MFDIDEYYKNGYLTWKLESLLPAEDIDQFNKLADQVLSLPVNEDSFSYILSVLGFHNDPEWPFKIPLSEMEWRFEKIKNEKLHITQRWYQSIGFNNLKTEFQKIANKFLVKLYKEFKSDYSNIYHQDAFTIYKNGDYTEIHRDGQNQGRVCVILMYLTPETNYKNSGGELVITGDDNTQHISLIPVRGNAALIDFNNHNPFHVVELVKDDFVRYCYISFVWNIDKMPENNRPKRI